MKKFLPILVSCFVLGSVVFAQESKPMSFKIDNKFYSDIVQIAPEGNGVLNEGNAAFAGMYDQVKFSFTSSKIDAMVKFRLNVLTKTNALTGLPSEGGWPIGFEWKNSKFDWHFIFRPVSFMAIGAHQKIYIPGSYFFVEDDNLNNGNIGSDGVTLSFTPVKGLIAAVTVPVSNYFAGLTGDSQECTFKIGAGVAYQYNDLFSIGGAFKYEGYNSVARQHDFTGGVYASVKPCKEFELNVGYSYKSLKVPYSTDLFGITGQNVSLSMKTEYKKFWAAVDYQSDFEDKFYNAWQFGYNFTKLFTLEVKEWTNTTYSNAAMGEFYVEPQATFHTSKVGNISIAVNIHFDRGQFSQVYFPLTWKYKYTM